jgi:hypothetical protein
MKFNDFAVFSSILRLRVFAVYFSMAQTYEKWKMVVVIQIKLII